MIWTAAALAVTLLWSRFALRVMMGRRRIPDLCDIPPLDSAAPRLSVIVPARDEAAAIGPCLESLLAQDHPDLEIIAVDDRSTDGTGAVMDEMAARSGGRLRVEHITALPAGWLGKCHALHVGAARATGEFVLFTDGDVIFEPSALSCAVAHATREDADQVVAMPGLLSETLGERVLLQFFVSVLFSAFPPWRAMNPRTAAFCGTGAFNLVRRSLWERLGGHRRLRLEVIDDVMLGREIKRAGGRVRVFAARDLIRVRWHATVAGLIRGLEKNFFAALRYRVTSAALGIIAMLALAWWPIAGMFLGPPPARALCAVTAVVIWPIAGGGMRRFTGLPLWLVWTTPLGAASLGVAVMRSTWVTLRQGGVRWRDTFHPLAELRAFSRALDRGWQGVFRIWKSWKG